MKAGHRIADLKPPQRKTRDIYVYFDNDAKAHAPFDALRLAERLGVARDPYELIGSEGDELPPPPRFASAEK